MSDSNLPMPLKSQQISDLILQFNQFRDLLTVGASLMGAAVIALDELQQQRQAMQRGVKAGNWEEVMKEVRKIDKRLAEHLAGATIKRFDQSALKVTLQNDQELMFCQFGKDRILKQLQKIYGPTFKLSFGKKT